MIKILNSCFTVICVSKMTWGWCLLMTRTFNSKTGKKKNGHALVVNHMFSDFLHIITTTCIFHNDIKIQAEQHRVGDTINPYHCCLTSKVKGRSF